MKTNRVYHGDVLGLSKAVKEKSVHCCVTSPPYYGLRNYGIKSTEWPEVAFSPMAGLPELIIAPEKSCLGLEFDIWAYVGHMVLIAREIRRVLREDGVMWLNLGDGYSGGGNGAANYPDSSSKKQLSNKGRTTVKGRNNYRPNGLASKNLLGIPWRVAFALQADGWWLRQDIIWSKPNPMPESVRDRCTKSHEYVFLLSKSQKYYFNHEAIKEHADWSTKNPSGGTGVGFGHGYDVKTKPRVSAYSFARKTATQGKPGVPKQHREDREDVEYKGKRNKRSVWTVATYPYKKAHFATFPPKLIEPCILTGCPKGGIVLDPFMGTGTTGFVAAENNRNYIGFEINPKDVDLAKQRIRNAEPRLF